MENNKWYKNWKILTAIALTVVVILSITLGLFLGMKDNSKSNDVTTPIPPGYEISAMDEMGGSLLKLHFDRDINIDSNNSTKEYEPTFKLDAFIGIDIVIGKHLHEGVLRPYQDIAITVKDGDFEFKYYDPETDLTAIELKATFDSILFEYYSEYVTYESGSGDTWIKYKIVNNLDLQEYIFQGPIYTILNETYDQKIVESIYTGTMDWPISSATDTFEYGQTTTKNLSYDAEHKLFEGETVSNMPEDIHYNGDITLIKLFEEHYSDDMSIFGKYEYLNELLTNGVLAKEYTPQYIWTCEASRLDNTTFEWPSIEWLEDNQMENE